MAKLHELLAIEREQKTQAQKVLGDLKDLFNKKVHHFTGKLVTFKPDEEGKPDQIVETRDLVTTVSKELQWASDFLVKAFDTSLTIAETNTEARADIVVKGNVIAASVPATYLLELEKKLGELREFVDQIPTLDPSKGFIPDETQKDGVFRAKDEVKPRTQKMERPVVLYEATKEHPAQVTLKSYDEKVGMLHSQEWSGAITPRRKADILTNIETLTRAVKKARARANSVDIKQHKIGRQLWSFAFAETTIVDEE